MFAGFERRPIAQQLILATIAALVAVFAAMALVVQNRADSSAVTVAERNLEHEAKLMAGMLDSIFDAVKTRGEDESRYFSKFMGAHPEPGGAMVKTGAVDLPLVKIGSEILNGNDRQLKAFRDLTGDDAAFLIIHDNKLYRLATLLKDKDGNSMAGTRIPDSDPVARAVLAGKDYQGLAIRGGKYNFSTVKLLKGADGKVWGALSVRISLDSDLKRIRDQFGAQVAGKTGYVYIVRPTDEKTIGEFVLHPKLQGMMVGEADVPAVTKTAIADLLGRKSGLSRYVMTDATGAEREKIVYGATSEGWGWMVATGSWLDEYLEESHGLRNLVIAISVAAAVVLATLVYLLISLRLRGLAEMVGAATRISGGDLRIDGQQAIDPASRNEVHVIGRAFREMSENVRNLVLGVAASSSQVGASAVELQNAARSAHASAEQAATSATGIAASIEQLSVSITQVADNANQAAQISESAKEVTIAGRQVVSSTVLELERVATDINESAVLIESLGERSKQISSVVGVIREIADQTNLLALNAAIEAARAGEQGRGFAVVADEVRKLAERTSLSTQEITSTVSAILDETGRAVQRMQNVSANMSDSVDLARQAGQSLQVIEQRTEETVEVVQGIADSTREQSAASQEVARLVEQIAQTADGSNSRALQNSARAESLQLMAAKLQDQLARFTT